jgi:hypothetical protein
VVGFTSVELELLLDGAEYPLTSCEEVVGFAELADELLLLDGTLYPYS